jgi:hypothetical protein
MASSIISSPRTGSEEHLTDTSCAFMYLFPLLIIAFSKARMSANSVLYAELRMHLWRGIRCEVGHVHYSHLGRWCRCLPEEQASCNCLEGGKQVVTLGIATLP